MKKILSCLFFFISISILSLFFYYDVQASNSILFQECRYNYMSHNSDIVTNNITTVLVWSTEMRTSSGLNTTRLITTDERDVDFSNIERLRGSSNTFATHDSSVATFRAHNSGGSCPGYVYLIFHRTKPVRVSEYILNFADTLPADCTSSAGNENCPWVFKLARSNPVFINEKEIRWRGRMSSSDRSSTCYRLSYQFYFDNSRLAMTIWYDTTADNAFPLSDWRLNGWENRRNIWVDDVTLTDFRNFALNRPHRRIAIYTGNPDKMTARFGRSYASSRSCFTDDRRIDSHLNCITWEEVQARNDFISAMNMVETYRQRGAYTNLRHYTTSPGNYDFLLQDNQWFTEAHVRNITNNVIPQINTRIANAQQLANTAKQEIEAAFMAIADLEGLCDGVRARILEQMNSRATSISREIEGFLITMNSATGVIQNITRFMDECERRQCAGAEDLGRLSDALDNISNDIATARQELRREIDLFETRINLLDGNRITDVSNLIGCEMLAGEFINFLTWIFRVIQIAGMILVFVLGIVDFMSASASSQDDAMKKAGKKFSTRIIVLTVLLILPTLITFILQIVNMGVISENPICGIRGL